MSYLMSHPAKLMKTFFTFSNLYRTKYTCYCSSLQFFAVTQNKTVISENQKTLMSLSCDEWIFCFLLNTNTSFKTTKASSFSLSSLISSSASVPSLLCSDDLVLKKKSPVKQALVFSSKDRFYQEWKNLQLKFCFHFFSSHSYVSIAILSKKTVDILTFKFFNQTNFTEVLLLSCRTYLLLK